MRVDVQRDAVPICWALLRIGDRFVASVHDPIIKQSARPFPGTFRILEMRCLKCELYRNSMRGRVMLRTLVQSQNRFLWRRMYVLII